MKSFKKQILVFIILLIGIFFIGIDNVEATKLDTRYYTLQCIYGDGGLYTRSIDFGRTNFDDGSDWKYNNNRTTYNLRGVSDVDNTNTGSFKFVNKINKDVNNTNPAWTCQDYVRNAIYKYSDDEENTEGGTSFYKFGGKSVEITDDEFGTSKSGWESFWGLTSASEEAANAARSTGNRYKLISESYILSANAPTPNRTVYYVQEAEQAAGTNKYIEIMIYDNAVLLKSDTMITQVRYGEGAGWFIDKASTGESPYSIKSEFPEKICINTPEAMVDTAGGAKLSYYYNTGQVRYTVGAITSKKKDCEKNEVNIYTITSEPPLKTGTDTGALCTKIMPKTAEVLREIIKYAQIIVPILLIALIGLDIGKVVMAGNLDEELPKIKTKIIVRLIVAITFFFLPLIVTLVLNMIKTSGEANASTIELISCLFT